MANPKVKPEGKKIAEKVMDFIDMNPFGPIFKVIKKSEGYHVYIREILGCIPTRRMIGDLDERGELHEAYKEYVYMNGVTLVKDIAKGMANKEQPKEPVSNKGNKIIYTIKDSNGNTYPVTRLSERVYESKEHGILFITDEERVVTGIYKEK